MTSHAQPAPQQLQREVNELFQLLAQTTIDPADPNLRFARRLFLHCLEWRLEALADPAAVADNGRGPPP